MLDNGPNDQSASSEKPKISQFTDSSGTTYSMADDSFLGGGIEGRVFEGVVVSRGKNADPFLTVGTKVAIKQQPLQVPGISLQEKTQTMQREIDLLVKEGSCFGSSEAVVNGSTFMYVAIPKIKGVTLREAMYEIKQGAVDSKKDLTADQKKSICYGLLKDYAAQQMLSILHVDIKPDNMLLDLATGKVKVIDFGNGYDRDLFAEHPEGFQSPGDLYAAQENYDPSKKREELKCGVKADGYAIGILLASIWSKSCYEKDAVTGTGADNGALMARKSLADILAPNAHKPADMPDDLFQIIRHLAAIEPNDRPENIALANGIATSVELKAIRDAQARLNTAKTEIKDNVGNNMQALSASQGKTENQKYIHLQNLDANLKTLRSLITDPANFNKKLAEYATAKDIPESSRQLFKAMAKDTHPVQKKLDRLVRETHALRNPLEKINHVFQTLENLTDIADQYAKIDADKKMPPKRQARLKQETTDEFNKVLAGLVQSNDQDYIKLVGKAAHADADPVTKIAMLNKNYREDISKLINKSLKEGSLYSQIESRINHVVGSTSDIPTLRIELMKMYKMCKDLEEYDSRYTHQCTELMNVLGGMVTRLDTLRGNEARALQGKQQHTAVNIPHALPPMAPVIIQRKLSTWKKLKKAYKKFKATNTIPAQTQAPVLVQIPVQQAQPLAQVQPSVLTQAPLQPQPVKAKPLPPRPQTQTQANPLFLQQRLSSILAEHSQPKTNLKADVDIDALLGPKPNNPLDFRPKVPPKLARKPQSQFVTQLMEPIIECLDKLIAAHDNIKMDDSLQGADRVRAQRSKEAVFVEIRALSNILVYLKNNPTMQQNTSDQFGIKVADELKKAQDERKKVATAAGVGDLNNSNYQLSAATNNLLRDMVNEYKPVTPTVGRHQVR